MSNLLGYAAAIPGAIVGLLISTFFGDVCSRVISSLVDVLSEWIFTFFPIRKESTTVEAASDGGKINSDICKEAVKEAVLEVTREAKKKTAEAILDAAKEAKKKAAEAITDVAKEAKEKTSEAILKVTRKAKEKTAKVAPIRLFLRNRVLKIHAVSHLKLREKS